MITFYCNCGQKIKVSEKYAGKKGKCPRCKQVIEIPKTSDSVPSTVSHEDIPRNTDNAINELDTAIGEMLEHQESASKEAGPLDGLLGEMVEQQQSAPEQNLIAENTKPTKPCPYCGENILAIANKCKHCGEFLTKGPRRPMRASTKPRIVVAPENNKWSGGRMTLYVLCALLVPIVGVIAGIVGLAQRGKRGQGLFLLLLAVVAMLVGYVVITSLTEGDNIENMQNQIRVDISKQTGVTCTSVILIKESSNRYTGLATFTTGEVVTVTATTDGDEFIWTAGN